MKHFQLSRAFTLIEVMIVIAIIGLLASVVLSSLALTKDKANTAERLTNAKEVEKALELYYTANGAYPTTGGSFQSSCSTWGGITNYVPGISAYLSVLPTDPDTDGVSQCCYIYRSNGTDYKFMFGYGCSTKMSSAVYASYPRYIDPKRDGEAGAGCPKPSANWNGSTSLTDWAIFSPGGCAW